MNTEILNTLKEHFRPGYIFRYIEESLNKEKYFYIILEIENEIQFWKDKITEDKRKINEDPESIKADFYEGSLLNYELHINELSDVLKKVKCIS